MSANEKGAGMSQLTKQENKVLELVVKAKSNKEIARDLGISPSTVKRHMENILGKLHLKNRIAAAVYAITTENCPLHISETKKAA